MDESDILLGDAPFTERQIKLLRTLHSVDDNQASPSRNRQAPDHRGELGDVRFYIGLLVARRRCQCFRQALWSVDELANALRSRIVREIVGDADNFLRP